MALTIGASPRWAVEPMSSVPSVTSTRNDPSSAVSRPRAARDVEVRLDGLADGDGEYCGFCSDDLAKREVDVDVPVNCESGSRHAVRETW